MIEMQTAVDTMMNLILFGGAEAAKGLFKGRVLDGAREVSRSWHELFGEAPDAYPLADRLARSGGDADLEDELRTLVARVLSEHPEMVPAVGIAVQTGDIKAKGGSVAVGVMHGSHVTIKNSK